MLQTLLDDLKTQEDRYLEELKGWLQIPSISADSEFRPQTLLAAEYLMNQLSAAGAEDVQLLDTPGFPVVFAQKLVDPAKPTVLIYGHYDVQPPDPLNLWTTPPFEPRVHEGKLYARGAADDKGQVYMHVAALSSLNRAYDGQLPCNIKFFIEGEEEVGSPNLDHALERHRDKLDCDLILVSDTAMLAPGVPSLTVSLRGLSYVEIEVTGPNRDLHSGVYGGAVSNPVNALCEMIAGCFDANRRITIPGFYDNVVELSQQEREELARTPFDLDQYQADLGVDGLRGEAGFSPLEHTGIRPSLDVNGIWGGYIGEGAKTVLPSKAYAKLSTRLVPNQDPERITRLLKEYFEAQAPAGTRVQVTPHHGGQPFVTDSTSKAYAAALQALEDTYQAKPIPTREGGSIPILSALKRHLDSDVVLMGFGLNSDAIHSPDEHYRLANFYQGIETIMRFHELYAK